MWAWVVWVRTLAAALAFIKFCWVAKAYGKLKNIFIHIFVI